MEVDLAGVRAAEARDGRRARIAQLARPGAPVEPALAARSVLLAERDEGREVLERLALAREVGRVGAAAGVAPAAQEAAVERPQDLALRGDDPRVLDVRGVAQPRDLALEARTGEPRAGLRAARELRARAARRGRARLR